MFQPGPAPASTPPARLPSLPPAVWRWVERWTSRAAALGAVLVFCILGHAHLHLVVQPGPQELNEPAAWYATWLLDQGRNPYTLAELPAAAQFFGPLYNFVVLALKPVFGLDYSAHRLINFFCLAGVLALLGRAMLRRGASWGIALLATAIVYQLATNNIMTTARPDALGWLLFTAALVLADARDYRRGAVVIALAFTVVATQCKVYFTLAAVPILLGVALRRSFREALALGLALLVAQVATYAAFSAYFPLYFVQTVLMQAGSVQINSAPEFYHLHTVMLAKYGWAFLVVLAFAAAHALAPLPGRAGLSRTLAVWRSRDATVARPFSGPMVLTLSLLLIAVPVQAFMAQNGGATFTYHIHLLFPFFCLLLGTYVTNPARRLAAILLLGLNLALVFERPWMPDSAPGYSELARRLQPHQRVLALGTTVQILVQQGKEAHNDGFTLFLPCAFGGGGLGPTATTDALSRRFSEMVESIRADVIARRFDVILTHDDWNAFCDLPLLQQHYERRPGDVVDVPMRFAWDHLSFWYPKPASPPSVQP